ncbi:MAG: DUF427 domain-containing protein [Candidatus Nanopelagicales bacterium]
MSTIRDRLRRFAPGTATPDGPVEATWNGAVIASSERTVYLEGNHYFPEDAIDRAYLERSDRKSLCPWKGTARYYDVVVDGKRNPAAAWYYPRPTPAATKIKGHVAFWHGVKVRRVPAS